MQTQAATPGQATPRLTNFEFLRILAMLFVIAIHLGVHSGIFETGDRSATNYVFSVVLKNISNIAVNCYILLTGYFLCRSSFRFEKALVIYLQVFYYSIFFLVLSFFLPLTPEISRTSIFWHSIFPFSTMQYWFVSSYLVILFLSPFLNLVIERINRGQFLTLLLILFVISSLLPSIGQDIFATNHKSKLQLFLLLYFTGAYCRDHVELKPGRWKLFLTGYLLFTGLNFVLLLANLLIKKRWGVRPFNCEDFMFVFTYASSIFFFLFWGCVQIRSACANRLITLLAPLTFGVYLFHENPYFFDYLWHNIIGIQHYFRASLYPVYCFGAIIGIYLAGSAFDWVRQLIFLKLRIRERIGETALCRRMNAWFGEQTRERSDSK